MVHTLYAPYHGKTSTDPQYHHDGMSRPVQLLIHQTEHDNDTKKNHKLQVNSVHVFTGVSFEGGCRNVRLFDTKSPVVTYDGSHEIIFFFLS